MITLAHLRALLERALTHAENPAIVRLTARTVEVLALAYLPRTVWRSWVHDGPEDFRTVDDMRSAVHVDWAGRRTLDLTDPGTAHALLVALALALGLDPGPLALGCSWQEFGDRRARVIDTPNGPEYRSPAPAWAIDSTAEIVMFGDPGRWRGRIFPVPEFVEGETDARKALVLAALYVLEHP